MKATFEHQTGENGLVWVTYTEKESDHASNLSAILEGWEIRTDT